MMVEAFQLIIQLLPCCLCPPAAFPWLPGLDPMLSPPTGPPSLRTGPKNPEDSLLLSDRIVEPYPSSQTDSNPKPLPNDVGCQGERGCQQIVPRCPTTLLPRPWGLQHQDAAWLVNPLLSSWHPHLFLKVELTESPTASSSNRLHSTPYLPEIA